MKRFIAILLVSLSMFTVFANGVQETDSPQDGPTYVDVYIWSSGDDTESKYIEAYNAQATDVIITPHYIPSSDYESKLTTLLAGGVDIDIFFQKRQTDMFPHFANGYIEPLNDLIEKHGFDYSSLSSWDSSLSLDGQVLALPYRAGKHYTYYNAKAFTDKGLPTPQDLVESGEWTWNKFIELSQKVSENDGETYGSCIYIWGTQQILPAAQKGVEFIKADGTIDMDESILFSAKMRKTLEEGNDMTRLVDLKVSKTHYSQVMLQGMAPMLIIGEWFPGMLHGMFANATDPVWNEDDFRITRMPCDSPKYNSVGVPTFAHICTSSKKKDAAFQVLAWMASENGAEAAASLGILPPIVNDSVKKILSNTIYDETSLEYYLEDVPVKPILYNKYGSKIEQTVSNMTEKFLLNEVSEKDYLHVFKKELENIVDTTY